MEFRIADTFTDSLAKLTGDEQKAVKTTAFDLQLNPANPGMQFHRLDKARDKNFWSVRVSRDIRLIIHRTEASLLLCYVGHHDVGVPELRMLAVLGANRPNGLFFAGDLGQRIFKPPFSWKSLGVDVRGRSRTLRINYRTSHQIRSQADRLLPPEMSDVDGNKEQRQGTISAFEGPEPTVQVFDSVEQEAKAVTEWLKCCSADGVRPNEIGVFIRSPAQLPRSRTAVEAAGLKAIDLDVEVETKEGCVSILTMHLAKGLEFRAVAVIACDDEVLPLQERIANVGDDADLEEVYNTERHLLYVACTRARDRLLVSGVDPASEFLDDLAPVNTSKKS